MILHSLCDAAALCYRLYYEYWKLEHRPPAARKDEYRYGMSLVYELLVPVAPGPCYDDDA
jgi:hypothetical protein